MRIEHRIDFLEFILSLPKKEQRAVCLLLIAGYNKKEVASLIGYSRKTVHKWLKDIKLRYMRT